MALGLMAKPMLVTLPCVLLLLDIWPLRRWRGLTAQAPAGILFGRLLWEKLPFFGLTALSCAVTLYAQQQAMISVGSLPLMFRLANAVRAYAVYIVKMVWPANLAVIYPMPVGLSIWEVLGAVLFLLTISAGVLLAWRRWPYLLVGWCWFLGTLVPVIGVVQVGQQAYADRYTYIPLIGLFIVMAWGGAELVERWRCDRRLLTALAVALLAGLAVTSCFQTRHWRTSEELFRHTVAVTPPNHVARLNLGAALEQQGRHAEAIAQLLEALRINPESYPAHFALGIILQRTGDLDRSLWHLQQALLYYPQSEEARQALEHGLWLKNSR
jgi:hypothetical protein